MISLKASQFSGGSGGTGGAGTPVLERYYRREVAADNSAIPDSSVSGDFFLVVLGKSGRIKRIDAEQYAEGASTVEFYLKRNNDNLNAISVDQNPTIPGFPAKYKSVEVDVEFNAGDVLYLYVQNNGGAGALGLKVGVLVE